MIFKPNEEALVIDNPDFLDSYGAQEMAGKKVIIICNSTLEGRVGYDVEYTSPDGYRQTYFIQGDHLSPVPSRLISGNDPNWKRVADSWQDYLWKQKMENN